MTATSSYALTTEYDSASDHVGLSTYENNVFSHSWFLIPWVFHQLKCCWGTVLAGNTNLCLYYMSEVNNLLIYLSFDNSRQEQLAPLDSIREMKLCWHRITQDVNPAEA